MQPRDDSAPNPFEVLGVGRDATDRDVRRAFALKIREARSAGDPDVVERIQRAFEAIRDEDSRRRLRDVLENRSEVDRLWRLGADALDEEAPRRALDAFRGILAIVPDFEPALVQVVVLEGSIGNHEGAATAARRLVTAVPDRGEHHELLARALLAQARDLTNDWVRRNRVEEALAAARRARELGRDGATVIAIESQALWLLDRRQEARALVAAALEAATKVHSGELELFLVLLRIDAAEPDVTSFSRTLGRMTDLLPESPDARRWIGYAVCDLGAGLLEDRPKLAERCAELGATCCPGDAGVSELLDRCRAAIRAREASRLAREHISRSRRAEPTGGRSWSWLWLLLIVPMARACVSAIHSGSRIPGSSRRYDETRPSAPVEWPRSSNRRPTAADPFGVQPGSVELGNQPWFPGRASIPDASQSSRGPFGIPDSNRGRASVPAPGGQGRPARSVWAPGASSGASGAGGRPRAR